MSLTLAGGRVFRAIQTAVLAAFLTGCGALEDAPSADIAETAGPVCHGISEPGMVWVEGGDFVLGADPQYQEEGPPRAVSVEGFWISRTEVTNAQFAAFVDATGYRTEAERDPPKLAGAPPDMLKPGSAVFRVPTADNAMWWEWRVGAQWRHPSGPGSSIEGRDNNPVVQVTLNDAQAYAEWAGVHLPTEEQREYAARAGEEALPVPQTQDGKPTANFYQGVFPRRDLGEDGYTSRAPVGCFEANSFGLHDMIGNVWEWTHTKVNPTLAKNVIKGGSFLCAANYCARYRPSARQFQERDLGTDHIGFRVVDTDRPAPDR